MKLLINCPSNFSFTLKSLEKIGGIESLNIELAEILLKKKINVIISTNCIRKSIYKNIQNLPVKFVKNNSKIFNFDAIISSNDSDIFNYFPNSKKILWLHNSLQIEKSIRKKQFFSIFKNKPHVVFVSNYLNSITSKLYPFRSRVVIPNFLTSNFTTKIKPKKRKSIFVWSVQRDKGLINTIDMWINNVFPVSKKSVFYITGINKSPPKYNIKFLKTKNIFFMGRVSKNRLKLIYSQSTAMICLGYDETFCLNALEANSCGLPVITFGKTALKEIIKDNYNGFIVNNFTELSKKILTLSNFKESKNNKIIKNSINYSKNYDLKNIIYNWLNLLK